MSKIDTIRRRAMALKADEAVFLRQGKEIGKWGKMQNETAPWQRLRGDIQASGCDAVQLFRDKKPLDCIAVTMKAAPPTQVVQGMPGMQAMQPYYPAYPPPAYQGYAPPYDVMGTVAPTAHSPLLDRIERNQQDIMRELRDLRTQVAELRAVAQEQSTRVTDAMLGAMFQNGDDPMDGLMQMVVGAVARKATASE